MTRRSVWRDRATQLEQEAHALFVAYQDPRTPRKAKLVLILLIGYVLSPIDPLPDALPIIGILDELLVLAVGLMLLRRLLPEPVIATARETAGERRVDSRAKWVVAGLIIVGWLGLASLLLTLLPR